MIRKLKEKFLSSENKTKPNINHPSPKIDPTAWVAPDAVVIGDVEIGANTTVWPGAVIRGDIGKIEIGENCNIQDNAVIHPNSDDGIMIGNNVTIAHSAVIDGCDLGDNVVVGINSTILHNSKVKRNTIVGAASLLQPGTETEPNSVYNGSPAQKVRDLTEEDKKAIENMAKTYTKLKDGYK